ncbi:MAG TPA: TIGR03905 family TSCPD domain-containing protein [Clostridia bacterium]|nr:TIGR03905 family TSCPD domain-containing protein [Clostridia bacterium]
MDKHVVFKTKGVCSQEIEFDIVNDVIHNCTFLGGCRGNTVAITHLVEGMNAEEVVKRCKGIGCQGPNSCPDQLAQAIEKAFAEN